MSLRNNTLWEVLKSAFSKEVWALIWPATWETLYMVGVASIFVLIFGTLLGILLLATDSDGVRPMPWLYKPLSTFVNCFRSLPQMIIILLMLPLARLITGQSYGSGACIIALVASCVPMFGRMVQSSLLEISKGKLEAAKAMGSGNLRILFGVVLPECLPSLIRAFTVAVVAVVSMTALAGSFGAGGLGDIAVRYGFNRFQHDMLIATVLVLLLIVQLVQWVGDIFSKLFLKKWHLV